MPTELIEDNYSPSEEEPFMNDRQRDYFRRKLLAWKEDILRESRGEHAVERNQKTEAERKETFQ